MNRRVAFPALLATLFLLPAFADAQPSRIPGTTDPRARTYTVRGNLRFAHDERPVENVKIELRRFSGDVAGTTFTRNNGEFEFAGLTTGQFYLIVEESGYESVRESVEIRGTSPLGLLVYLRKIATAPPEDSGNSVSALELGLPSKTRAAFRKGMDILYTKNDPAASLPVLQKVITTSPDFYEGYFHLGIAYDQLHRLEEAEVAFRKAIAVSGEKYPQGFIALGSLLNSLQKAAEAEAMVRRGLALNGSLWLGHYEMGQALVALNRLDEAEKSLGEVLKLRNDYAPTYLLLANVHIRMRNQSALLGDLNEFLRNQSALLGDLNEFLRLEPDGPQSPQARKSRDSIVQSMENAKNATAAPPKP
jgi:tetratricopeptide (TPR) repeat protein